MLGSLGIYRDGCRLSRADSYHRTLSDPRRPASAWRRRPPPRSGGRRCAPQIAWACASAASASDSVPASPMESSRLIAPYATVGPAASRAASSCAAGSTCSSSSTSRVSRPSRQRLRGAHRLGQQQQLERLGVPDDPRQRPGDAGVAGQADVGERHQERGARAADRGSRRAAPATRRPRPPCPRTAATTGLGRLASRWAIGL